MARTIVDIPEPQLRDIDELCRLLGISRAEAVRRALRDFTQRNADVKTDAFGLWAAAPADAAALGHRWGAGSLSASASASAPASASASASGSAPASTPVPARAKPATPAP